MHPCRRCRDACLLGLASLAWLATDAHGGEAVRYRNEQGIEMIGGRATAVPDAVAAPPAFATQRPGLARLQLPPHEPPAAIARLHIGPHEWPTAPLRLQIAPHEQQARDRDRLAILRQELDAESAAIQENIVHSRGLVQQPLQRSREQLRRHQQNIRDLHAEISRASKATK